MFKKNYLYDPQYGLLESAEKMPNITVDNYKLSTTVFPTLIDDIKLGKVTSKVNLNSKKIPVGLHRKMMSVDEGRGQKNNIFKKVKEQEHESRYSVSKLRATRFQSYLYKQNPNYSIIEELDKNH